jgi:hypothetical protein
MRKRSLIISDHILHTSEIMVSDKPGSGALAIAAREGIPQLIIEKENF